MKALNIIVGLSLFIGFNNIAFAKDIKSIVFENGKKGYIIQEPSGKGVSSEDGKIIITPIYDKIAIYGNLIFCSGRNDIENKKLKEVYDCNGRCILNYQLNHENLKFIGINGEKYIGDISYNRYKSPIIYDKTGKTLYKYKIIEDKRGFKSIINEVTDTIVVESGKYTELHVCDGYISAKIGEIEGCLSLSGDIIIPANIYKWIIPDTESTEIVGFRTHLSKFDGIIGYYSAKGDCIFPAVNYYEIYSLENGKFGVEANGTYSIADSLGNILFTTQYHGLHPIKDKEGKWYYKSYLGNGTGIVSENGIVIEEPRPTVERKEYNEKGYSYVTVRDEKGLWGIETPQGKTIITNSYDFIFYRYPYFKVKKSGKYGLIDTKGKIIIEPKYDYIYNNGNAKFFAVELLGRVGVCNKDGKEIVKPLYDDVSIKDGYILVNQGIYEGAIDYSGNILVPMDFTNVYKDEDGDFRVELFGKQGIYSPKNKLIVPPIYSIAYRTNVAIPKPLGEVYYVEDGDTKGYYSIKGELLFPTGFFKHVWIQQSDSNKKDLYIEAYNEREDIYYYDLKGKRLKCSPDEQRFYELSQEAALEFSKTNYNKSIQLYNKALDIKTDAALYYNVGLAYYALAKYSDAMHSFSLCLKRAKTDALIADAQELMDECQKQIAAKNERRAEIAAYFNNGLSDIISSLVNTNLYMNNYNSRISPTNVVNGIDMQTVFNQMMNDVYFKSQQEENQYKQQYTQNFKATMGREPTQQELTLAYTQYLTAKYGGNNGYSTSDDSNTSTTHTHFEHAEYGNGECTHCHGTGTCPTCNGKGWYIGGIGLQTLSCPNCDSSHNGKCHICHGTGKTYGRLN